MRQAFAHYAVLQLAAGGDEGAPGATITVTLCGHWEHEAPCPLAPHHTHVDRVEDELRLRTLFVAEPQLEDEVRQHIDAALASSRLVGPDGATTTWQLLRTRRGDVLESDLDQAERLIQS